MKLRRSVLWVLAVLIVAASVVLSRPGASYAHQDRDATLAAASVSHPAGTDALGRDRLVRVAAAFLLSLAGAIVASALTTAAAAGLGTLAAFGRSSIGWIAMLICDVFLALPLDVPADDGTVDAATDHVTGALSRDHLSGTRCAGLARQCARRLSRSDAAQDVGLDVIRARCGPEQRGRHPPRHPESFPAPAPAVSHQHPRICNGRSESGSPRSRRRRTIAFMGRDAVRVEQLTHADANALGLLSRHSARPRPAAFGRSGCRRGLIA
jgi:hypothetical protein